MLTLKCVRSLVNDEWHNLNVCWQFFQLCWIFEFFIRNCCREQATIERTSCFFKTLLGRDKKKCKKRAPAQQGQGRVYDLKCTPPGGGLWRGLSKSSNSGLLQLIFLFLWGAPVLPFCRIRISRTGS